MRIILADHNPQSLWGLKTMLEEKPGYDVIGEATDADGLLILVYKDPPDLALVDRELPGRPIEVLIKGLHKCKPRMIVVVMSSKPEFGGVILKAGADAFVSKGDQPDWLLETLYKFKTNFEEQG
jgi:DNA-binding NarL/FixJ family response regulator